MEVGKNMLEVMKGKSCNDLDMLTECHRMPQNEVS